MGTLFSGGRGAGQRDAMFALMARAAHPQATEQLFLKNGMSEAAIRDHEIQKNSDMIDFCTTTYSSIRNREYCIDVSAPLSLQASCFISVCGSSSNSAQPCACVRAPAR